MEPKETPGSEHNSDSVVCVTNEPHEWPVGQESVLGLSHPTVLELLGALRGLAKPAQRNSGVCTDPPAPWPAVNVARIPVSVLRLIHFQINGVATSLFTRAVLRPPNTDRADKDAWLVVLWLYVLNSKRWAVVVCARSDATEGLTLTADTTRCIRLDDILSECVVQGYISPLSSLGASVTVLIRDNVTPTVIDHHLSDKVNPETAQGGKRPRKAVDPFVPQAFTTGRKSPASVKGVSADVTCDQCASGVVLNGIGAWHCKACKEDLCDLHRASHEPKHAAKLTQVSFVKPKPRGKRVRGDAKDSTVKATGGLQKSLDQARSRAAQLEEGILAAKAAKLAAETKAAECERKWLQQENTNMAQQLDDHRTARNLELLLSTRTKLGDADLAVTQSWVKAASSMNLPRSTRK